MHSFRESGDGTGTDCRSSTARGSRSQRSKRSFEKNSSRKRKGKGQRSRSPAPRRNAADVASVQIKKRSKSLSGKHERPPVLNNKNGACEIDLTSRSQHYLRIKPQQDQQSKRSLRWTFLRNRSVKAFRKHPEDNMTQSERPINMTTLTELGESRFCHMLSIALV